MRSGLRYRGTQLKMTKDCEKAVPCLRQSWTFIYCSTCKRVLERRRFKGSSLHTCMYCLFNSRQRSKVRRQNAQTNCELHRILAEVKSGAYYCSSCKCTKPRHMFEGKRKTCSKCLRKRCTTTTDGNSSSIPDFFYKHYNLYQY